MTTKIILAAACALAIAGLTACGSSGSDSSSSSTAASAAASSTGQAATQGGQTASKNAEVDISDNPQLGQILVDADGNTLYWFEADKGTKSTCNGACAAAWPPYLTDGSPKAGSGADAAMLGSSQRDDGTTEVTYAGHPLYYYAGDTAPGDTNGNNLDQFGAEWYALTPKGENAEGGSANTSDTSTSTSTTSSSSGGSYGGY